MRFEEPVINLVDRFPEVRASRRSQWIPRLSQKDIETGVARGRALHGEFCRAALEAILVRPAGALLRTAAGLALSLARSVESARKRRDTIRTLHALDDRVLRDIGIERGDISHIADTLANASNPQPARSAQPAAREDQGEPFVPAHAA